jgi:hypothetical protein
MRPHVFLLPFAICLGFSILIRAGVAGATPMSEDEFWGTVTAPTATVDGEEQAFNIVPIFDEVNTGVIGYLVPAQTLNFAGGDEVSTNGTSFTLFDPVITLAGGVVDFGAPSNFTFMSASPLAPPITTLATGLLTISGSFADGASDGGSWAPFAYPLIAQATIENSGVADAGPAAVFATPGDVYGPFNVPYNFDCTALGDGQCDSFDVQVSFTGSGGNDAFSFTARHEINVPEPTTAALVGLGLVAMAVARRNRAL